MNEKWDEIVVSFELPGSSSYPSSRYRGSTLQIRVKKNCEVNRANIFCRKIKAEGSETFQNIFLFNCRLS